MTPEHNRHAPEQLSDGIAAVRGDEIVFKGSGMSHFSHVEGQGFHVTTAIPGFGAAEGFAPGQGLSWHDPVDPMGH